MSTIDRVSRIIATAVLAIVVVHPAVGHANDDKNRVRSLTHHTVSQPGDTATPGSTTIRIAGTRTPTFTVYKLERPSRVVVDIAKATLDSKITGRHDKATWSVGSWSVSQVATHTIGTGVRSTVRVIVTMARPGTYDVRADGKDVVVVVTPRDHAPIATTGRRIKKELERARSRASDARASAAKANAQAEKALQAEREARAAAVAAEHRAAANQTELKRLQRARAATQGELQRARKQAKKASAGSRMSKAEAERARKMADEARREADEMKRAARAAKAEVEEIRKAATEREAELNAAAKKREAKLRKQADKAIAKARAESESARARAEERFRQAERHMATADAKIAGAEKKLKEAKRKESAARTAQREVELAKERADEREREATLAGRRARERRAEAERAENAARKYLEKAEGTQGDREKGARLRERAEKAAQAADKRRAEAEKAAQAAIRARRDAENAARAAEERQHKAVAALEDAKRERNAAETAKVEAERQRVRADRERRVAEERRATAEVAAKEASKRAERATALRKREEAAHEKSSKARLRANAGRRAADAASERLSTAKREEKHAKENLASLRAEAKTAKRRLAQLTKTKNASKQEVADMKAEVERLTKAKKQATTDVRTRRRDVIRSQRELKKLERERTSKMAELAKVEKAAAQAKSAREREEKLLSALMKRRAAAEAELLAAENKRAQAQAKTIGSISSERNANSNDDVSRVQIRALDFEDKAKVARVRIELSGSATPRVLSTKGQKAILEVPRASLPAKFERTLDTSRYVGPIKAVSSYRDPRDPHKARVVVELNRPAKSALKRSGSTFYWDFAKKRSEVARAQTHGTKARPRVRMRNQAPVVVGGFGASSTPITQKSIAQLSRQKKKVYRGTKIDLDFKDADIHNLLRTLADVGGVNIVIPDEIQARVTVRLRRVPWDQALEVILASKGLWYRREGNLYRVAERAQLDKEDEAEAARLANLVKIEAPEPEIFTLNYSVAKDLKDQLEPLLSPKGRVQFDNRTNSIIINDVRAHRRRIIDLLKQLDTQTPQVQIEARIVEARSNFTREIGVQWGGSATASREGGNATGLIFPNEIGIRGGGEDNETATTGIDPQPSDFAVNLPAAVGTGTGGAIGLALGSVGGNLNLSLRLSALEDSGSVRIISAPKITVLNNVLARISQGVSIPVSVISANGVQTQFVPADLSLEVTPHVSQRDCTIQMELAIKKNEADFVNTGARGDPTILRKEANTTVLVADGETTVIGGIYTRNTGLAYSKVPFFGDLPVIGWLFKKRAENDSRTEVLVFITPKITNKAYLRCE